MLFISLVALCLAIIGAYAKPTIRPGGDLELSLSTPTNKVASASDLRVAATVKNAGDDDLKILKLGTVLDNKHPTQAFIVRKDGKEVPFIGTTYPTPTDGLSENDWVVIPAGKNVTAEHDVSALYDFSGSGPGTFSFDPVSRFQVIGVDDNVETTSDATPIDIANAGSVSITITTGLSKRKLSISPLSCGSRYDDVKASIGEAQTLAAQATLYIREKGADPLYNAYFGHNPTEDVINNFGFILGTNAHKEAYCECEPGVVSSENPDVYNTVATDYIFFCKPFFDQKPLNAICKKEVSPTVQNLRGGSTLRMLARTYVPGVAGQHRTCEQSRGLSDFDKITNNNNYECFATEAFATLC